MSSVVVTPRNGSTTCPLMDVAVGQTVRVIRLRGESALTERLLEQGLTVGTEVRVLRRGPFGGSVQLWLRGYALSLEASVAAAIEVTRPTSAQ